VRERGLGQVEERAEVHGKGPVTLLVGDVLELVVRHLLRGVHQDVDPPELRDGGIDDRAAVLRVGQVAWHQHRPAAGLLDPAGGLLSVVMLVEV